MAESRSNRLHPYISELNERLRDGRVGRREFLRTATVLGVSAAAAYAMAGIPGGDGLVGDARAAGMTRPSSAAI